MAVGKCAVVVHTSIVKRSIRYMFLYSPRLQVQSINCSINIPRLHSTCKMTPLLIPSQPSHWTSKVSWRLVAKPNGKNRMKKFDNTGILGRKVNDQVTHRSYTTGEKISLVVECQAHHSFLVVYSQVGGTFLAPPIEFVWLLHMTMHWRFHPQSGRVRRRVQSIEEPR